eukprot:gene3397-5053_t
MAAAVRRLATLSGAAAFPGVEAESQALTPLGLPAQPGLRRRPRFACPRETEAAVRSLADAALACALERLYDGLPSWEPERDEAERERRAARWGEEEPAGAEAAGGGAEAELTVLGALRRFARDAGEWNTEAERQLFAPAPGTDQPQVTTSELLRELKRWVPAVLGAHATARLGLPDKRVDLGRHLNRLGQSSPLRSAGFGRWRWGAAAAAAPGGGGRTAAAAEAAGVAAERAEGAPAPTPTPARWAGTPGCEACRRGPAAGLKHIEGCPKRLTRQRRRAEATEATPGCAACARPGKKVRHAEGCPKRGQGRRMEAAAAPAEAAPPEGKEAPPPKRRRSGAGGGAAAKAEAAERRRATPPPRGKRGSR